MQSFINNDRFPMWLYYFPLSLVGPKSSSCSTLSPEWFSCFAILNVAILGNVYFIVGFICFSLRTNYVEDIFNTLIGYLLCKSSIQVFCPLPLKKQTNWDDCLNVFICRNYFVYSRYKSSVEYMYCKYLF